MDNNQFKEHSFAQVTQVLLGRTTPSLRAVTVDFDPNAEACRINIFYNKKVTAKDEKQWHDAFARDLSTKCQVTTSVTQLSYPSPISIKGRFIYLRSEAKKTRTFFKKKSVFKDREFVNFEENIGLFIHPITLEESPTECGVIHTTSKGFHIIPGMPLLKNTEGLSLGYIQLSTQRALLGRVTPELRFVLIDFLPESQQVFFHLYHDRKTPAGSLELWECAISEVFADVGNQIRLNIGIHRLDTPEKLTLREDIPYGGLIFARKEPE